MGAAGGIYHSQASLRQARLRIRGQYTSLQQRGSVFDFFAKICMLAVLLDSKAQLYNFLKYSMQNCNNSYRQYNFKKSPQQFFYLAHSEEYFSKPCLGDLSFDSDFFYLIIFKNRYISKN